VAPAGARGRDASERKGAKADARMDNTARQQVFPRKDIREAAQQLRDPRPDRRRAAARLPHTAYRLLRQEHPLPWNRDRGRAVIEER